MTLINDGGYSWMKYEVQPTTKFEKDLKLCKSRGYDIELINQIIKNLLMEKS